MLEVLGFTDDLGLSATMLLVRDLSDPEVRLLNRRWWYWILNGSRRDQLSFEPAAWSVGIDVNRLDVDWREDNAWMSRIDHARPHGTVLDHQNQFSEDAASFAFPAMPPGYPTPSFSFDETWTEEELD